MALVLLALGLILAPSALPKDEVHWVSSARTIKGFGKRVVSVTIARSDPIVITGSNRGSSNFIVHLVRGSNTDFVINEIGPYSGQAVVEEARAGRYRVVVDAAGAWTLTFAQSLIPTRSIPSLLTGKGSRVVPVRVKRGLQPIVTASHRGQSNFIVHVIGYGKQYGFIEYVFNEIGSFRGQTLINDLPAGTYYVGVDASGGTWSLRFTR